MVDGEIVPFKETQPSPERATGAASGRTARGAASSRRRRDVRACDAANPAGCDIDQHTRSPVHPLAQCMSIQNEVTRSVVTALNKRVRTHCARVHLS